MKLMKTLRRQSSFPETANRGRGNEEKEPSFAFDMLRNRGRSLRTRALDGGRHWRQSGAKLTGERRVNINGGNLDGHTMIDCWVLDSLDLSAAKNHRAIALRCVI